MTTSLTLRNVKGSPLTYTEVDDNFTALRTTADGAEAAATALASTITAKAEASALGVLPTDTDMGTFTGSTIPDSSDAKEAIQAIETAVELRATTAALADNAGADSGDSLIGSDDGASGSLWTTVKGFINYLRSSVGSSIVGFIQSGTGAVARTVEDELRDRVSVKQFGAVGTTALLEALDAHDHVFVNAGTYNGPIDITQSGKTLVMEEGVEFFLPNGTVLAGATSGPSVLKISGDNVTIQGDFTVNGNKANNDSSSFPTSVLTGSFMVTGNNCRIDGTAHVVNAYYIGATVGDSLVSGGEVQGFHAKKLTAADANYYSVLLWSVVDWNVDEIRATAAVAGVTRDQRIRTGTQLSATSVCARGHIGLVYTDTNCAFVGEAHTTDVSIDTVMTGDGGKLEDCLDVRIGNWDAYNCSRQAARTAFAFNNCENCHVDVVTVNNFDDDGSNIPAYSFSGVTSCSVGRIVSVGNKTDAPNVELRIRQCDGLHLGFVVLRDPVGTCNGFLYDHGYPVQQDIIVDDLVSRGHTTWDVTVENKTAITIRSINSDALNQLPTTTDYPNITDKEFYEVGDWVPTYTTSGADFGSVTYDGSNTARFVRIGKLVHISGFMRTDAITAGAATGVVCIGNLPFTAKNDAGAYAAIALSSASGFAGDIPISGRTVINTTRVELYYRTTSNGADNGLAVADMATGANANSITFGGTYEIE